MDSNRGKIVQELRIIFSQLDILPKYRGGWNNKVNKHKPMKKKFMRTDLYQYIVNEKLMKISKDSFIQLMYKYLFFKIAHGGKHLFSPTQYKTAYKGSYSDEGENTYLHNCTEYEDEIDEELSQKYVKKGDDYFQCCYFIPDLLIERMKEDIDNYLTKNSLFLDILYQFINK